MARPCDPGWWRRALVVVSLLGGCGDSPAGSQVDGTGIEIDVPPVEEAVAEPASSEPIEVVDEGPGVEEEGPQVCEFGYPCTEEDDCCSGYCVDSPAGKVCTFTCGDEPCPEGWSCDQITQGGETAFICVAKDLYLCRPCHGDTDCNHPGAAAKSFCAAPAEIGLCTRACAEGDPCPAGYTCEVPEDGAIGFDICVPEGGTCACTQPFVDAHASRGCRQQNQFGTCLGEATCEATGSPAECDAQQPAAEVCNELDDDCDGDTDEEASGCTTWFQDSDGDKYGLGTVGTCSCTTPEGGNWIAQGGDCNELVTAINPGAAEACNGADDNCDGATDEPGATSCKPHFVDGDEDGWGVAGQSECLCAGSPGFSPSDGDCDDAVGAVNPDADEECDGIDNDCDDKTDEEDAIGCKPYFLDQDGDSFGLTEKVKCLCGPTGVYLTTKPGDCNDTADKVSPQGIEVCNGIDDNCNNKTDEGEGISMCPSIANGTAGCVPYDPGPSPCGLAACCVLTGCNSGWSDADGDPSNGCECAAGSLEAAGQTCQSSLEMGNLLDDGKQAEVTDNIVPDDDVDWFRFNAIDGADPGGCDSFEVRVFFAHNPQEQFAFDVYKGGCAGSQQMPGCSVVTEMSETTHFYDPGGGGAPSGECPCVAGTTDYDTAPGVELCSDQSAVYYVKVYRKPDHPPSCAAYTLRVTNGY
jgi:hypothetical protein